MLKPLHLAALAAAIVVMPNLGAAQTAREPLPTSSGFVMRSWDTADGLPDNNVYAVAQTPDGYMWIATRAGLARFDGVRITVSRKDNLPGLESDNIHTAYVSRDGALWLGLERGGVARLAKGKCELIVPMATKDAGTRWVSSFAEDREGGVWFGFAPEPRLKRWSAAGLATFGVEEGLQGGQDMFVHADKDGHIWAANKVGAAYFDGKRFQQIDREGGRMVHLAPARNGGVWATRGDHLLQYRVGGSKKVIADLTPVGGAGEITAVFETRDGNLWLGTSGAGLVRVRSGRLQLVATSHSFIVSLGEDRAGNLWVGTQGGGVNLITPRRFTLRDRRAGLAKDSIVSICTDAAGKLWVAPRWAAPAHATDANNKGFETLENWYARSITTVCADRDGGVWFGHDGGKFARWFEGAITRPDVPYLERIETMLVDSTGALWIATMDGPLVCWRDNAAEVQPVGEGLQRVRALAEDAAGRVWAGTEQGRLFRRENGSFVPVAMPQARADDAIRFLVPDGDDTVWIGTRNSAVLRWRRGAFERWGLDRGLPHDDVRALVIDAARDVWLGTARGLFRVNRKQLEAVLDGQQPRSRAVFFGANEGMPHTSFSYDAGRNATTRTKDGRLWFATDRGVLEVQPPRNESETPPAPVIVEELRANGAALPIANAEIAPAPKRIEIRFTAPYFGSPERVRFRYRLSGLDDSWTETGSERSAIFARLPAGDYRCEVAATDAEGEWQPRTAAIAFHVRAAWWEALWLRIVSLAFAAAALAWAVRAIVQHRMRARMRRMEEEHALERERIRIARDMHDLLGANLTQISIASQLARTDPPGTTGHLAEIASVARSAVESLDEIVWAVDPRHDRLNSLAEYIGKYAVGFLTSSGLSARVQIPDHLPGLPISSNVRHHLFLAVREALNNVVKHAGATTVWLQVEVPDGVLRVTVTDDGGGFAEADVEADANGLRNMRERLAEVRGTCRIGGLPEKGTRVICELPVGGTGG